jgi:hypothetical protein
MNERIIELVKEAKDHADYYAMLSDDVEQEIFTEKFAELIVRECVAICRDIDGEDNIDAKSGRQDCAVEIKEHFGVEE